MWGRVAVRVAFSYPHRVLQVREGERRGEGGEEEGDRVRGGGEGGREGRVDAEVGGRGCGGGGREEGGRREGGGGGKC